MKKAIGVLAVTIFVLIIGILLVLKLTDRKYDIFIPSVDGEVNLYFGKVGADNKIGQTTYQVHGFTLTLFYCRLREINMLVPIIVVLSGKTL